MLFVVAVALAVAVVLLLVVLKRRSRAGGRGDLLGPPRGPVATARPAPPPPASAPAADGWPEGAAPVGGLPDRVAAEARQLLAQHRKLEAVKLIRAATGCSLKEAKDRVELL